MDFPVDTVSLVGLACSPEPLENADPRWVDVQSLLHARGLTTLHNALLAPATSGFHHRCVCGHRGSGKSTDLEHFRAWAMEQQFLPIRIEVDKWFGFTAPTAADFFWLTADVADRAMRERGTPLPPETLRSVVAWFAEKTVEDKEESKSELTAEAGAQLESGIFNLGKLFGKFMASVKGSSSHALSVRERMRRDVESLRDLTNNLLRDVISLLGDQDCPNGLLVIYDNLDRLEPDVVETALFRESSDLINQIACHTLFVVPIGLIRQQRGALVDCYGPPIILPMLSLRPRGVGWAKTVAASRFDSASVARMRSVLEKRIDVATLLESEEDAIRLVQYSGGCLRDLMHLIVQAAEFREFGSATISTAAIDEAIQELRQDRLGPLEPEDFQILAELARGERASDETRKRTLLHQRAALAYRDDKGADWYDIHPLLVETEEFRNANSTRSH